MCRKVHTALRAGVLKSEVLLEIREINDLAGGKLSWCTSEC